MSKLISYCPLINKSSLVDNILYDQADQYLSLISVEYNIVLQ